jgi:hypothetical protein
MTLEPRMNLQRVEGSPICRNNHAFLQIMYRIRPRQEEKEEDKYFSTQDNNESAIATLVFTCSCVPYLPLTHHPRLKRFATIPRIV